MITGKDKQKLDFYRQLCAALVYREGGEVFLSDDEFELKEHPRHGGLKNRKENAGVRIKAFNRE